MYIVLFYKVYPSLYLLRIVLGGGRFRPLTYIVLQSTPTILPPCILLQIDTLYKNVFTYCLGGMVDFYHVVMILVPCVDERDVKIVVQVIDSDFKLHTLPSRLYTLLTLHTSHFTSHVTLILHTLHSTLYTLHSAFYILHSSLYTLPLTLYTLHSTLYALHFTLYP